MSGGNQMRIGIDIDDTLTEIKDQLTNKAIEYAKSLGKNTDIKQEIHDIYNNGNIYQQLFGFSYDELKYFLGTLQEEITNQDLPRKNCVQVIKKLHEEGHEIYIITARDCEFHEDPYLQSKTWLDKNGIYYDKLIVNARDKRAVCLEQHIDLLIDDSISNCERVRDGGIDAIMIGKEDGEINHIPVFHDWQRIYEYIHLKKGNA